MKRTLSMIALAVLTIGLLGSCSKINERLDNLDKRIDGIENEQIASINSQIDGIKTSIADLGTIRSDISSLKQSASDHSVDIFNLEEADRALKDRIVNLEDYVDAVLPNYAEKEWVEATFSTLAQYEATCDTIAKIDARIGALDAKLSKDIKACADSLTKWVNKQFEGYYTAAQMDAKLGQMKTEIDSAKAAGKITDAKADSIAAELTATKTAVDTAKAAIRAEYKAAVKSAIEESEGKLTKALNDAIATVNGTITALTGRVDALETSVAALTGRVDALEGMIQSVTIVPAYSDGSVEIANDSLYIDCIVSPSKAVDNLVAGNVAVLVNKVKTKANTGVDTIKIIEGNVFEKDADKGVISVRVFIKNKIPAADSTITVAVKIQNGISDFTTEFVPVYVAPKTTFKAVYNTSGGANTLTFYYDANDHSEEGITVYDNLPTAANNYAAWGYDGVRTEIKKVVITESVKDFSGLTSTAYMFFNMTEAESISGAEYLDVSNVTDMTYMFCAYGRNSTSLTDVPDVSGWKTDNVKKMGNLFTNYGQYSTSLPAPPDVSKWNTGNVTDMGSMFSDYGKNSTSLTAVPDVSGWKTDNVTKMGTLFAYYGDANKNNINCVLDLTGWNLANLTTGNNVFHNFSPNTFKVTIPAKTGENANLPEKWYGSGTSWFSPPTGKTFTPTLAGVFSVSATKKVRFSQGNLVATIDASGAPTAWKFAANQYDYLGEGGANKTIGSAAGDVDLFGWSTSTNVGTSTTDNYGIKTSTTTSDYSGDFYDWGKAVGDGNTWRTLSKDEWTYLFNNHSNIWATVNGVKGYVIAPDGFDGTLSSTYADDAALAANNLVFLPAAGYREGSTVYSVGVFGYYWSSTANDEYFAYRVSFGSGAVYPGNYDGSRYIGYSVRLVTEVK